MITIYPAVKFYSINPIFHVESHTYVHIYSMAQGTNLCFFIVALKTLDKN